MFLTKINFTNESQTIPEDIFNHINSENYNNKISLCSSNRLCVVPHNARVMIEEDKAIIIGSMTHDNFGSCIETIDLRKAQELLFILIQWDKNFKCRNYDILIKIIKKLGYKVTTEIH